MDPQPYTHTQLRGPRLTIARVTWFALVVLAHGISFAAMLNGFGELRTVCAEAECAIFQLTPEGARSLHNLGLSLGFYAWYLTIVFVAFTLTTSVIAAVIFWRKSDDWMAMFVTFALVALGAIFFRVHNIEDLVTMNPAWRWPAQFMESLAVASIIILFYVFPDGRFVPRWTRFPTIVAVAWALFPTALIPGLLERLLLLSLLSAGLFAQVYRYRRVSGPVQRQQTKWVMAGFTGVVVLVLIWALDLVFSPVEYGGSLFDLVSHPVAGFIESLLPISIAIAILRYRLWDIDILINRTLVYGALTAVVVGTYVLVVGSLGALFQARGSLLISLLAAGLVAVLFQPLRIWLQRGVNRLMYGERDDPYAVLSRLGERLEAALAPEGALPAIAETVAGALKLPYAAIALRQGDELRVVAEYPPPPRPSPLRQALPFDWTQDKRPAAGGPPGRLSEGEGETIALIYQSETVGQLILAPRAPGEDFTAADRRLLDDIARQAGTVAHAVRLTADLQRSRERLVTAREEERRRLRRDLHDGLGPQLASLTLKLDAVRNLLARDPDAADELVVQLKAQVQAAISDIRRLVYDLRPPALDELGLGGALREHAVSHSTADGPRISVEGPESLPPLPAAVEVAAYRIALEALTNVARHAGAQECVVRLTLDDALQLEITDDGVGLPERYQAGVGLTSMRERAAELGGTCVVEERPGGGTRVLATLPVSRET